MFLKLVLASSVLLQFTAAGLAVGLIRVTGRRAAWILIAAGITLMAIRRSITLARVLSSHSALPPDPAAEFISLLISILMVAGVALIVPLFQSHQNSQQALQQSERRVREQFAELELLYQTAPVGLCLMDTNLRYVRINDELAAINGRPAPEHIGLHLRDVIPEIAELVTPIYRTVLESGQPSLNFEVHGTTPSDPDRERDFLVSYHPLKDQHGQVIGVGTVVQDITLRKQAEQALRDSEERFRLLAENVPGVIYLSKNDSRNTMLYLNDMVGELTGYPKQEFLENRVSFVELFHPDDAPQIAPRVEQALAEQRPFRLVYRIRHRSGEWRWVEEVGAGVFRDGQLVWLEGFVSDITVRKRSEQARRDGEARMRMMLETSLDAVITIESDGKISDWNRNAEVIFGWPREQAVGRELAELIIPPDQREGHRQGLDRYLETGDGAILGERIEMTALRRDGSEFPIELTVSPLQLGRRCIFSAFVRDITDRKQAEAALRASEEQYRGMFQASTDGLIIIDPDRNLVEVNPAFCTMHGYLQDELLRLSPLEFIHPESHRLFDDFVTALSAGLPFHCEAQDLRKDGTSVDIEVHGVPFTYQGRPHLLGIVRDITERRAAEVALRESESRLRQIIDLVPDMIFTKDRDGRYLMVNQAVADVYGKTVAEIEGHMQSDFHPSQEELLPYLQDDCEVIDGGRSKFIPERAFVDVHGKERFVQTTKIPITMSGMSEQAVLGVAVDVTARKRAEDEKRAAQQSLLDHQRRERKRVEAELAKVKDELVRSTGLATVGKMSAQIAHDIRNPLGAILNTASFLKRELTLQEPRWREGLDLIQEEVDVCNRIINNLLDVTRGGEPQRKPTDLGELVQESADRLAVPHAVQVNCVCNPAPFVIEVDPVEFRRVLDNLIGNALDAVGRHGTVTVTASRDAEAETLIVEDSGPGIPEQHRQGLFDLFFTTKAQGTGLGLAICARIVEQHGGTLDLTDGTGTGAALRIRLPRS